MTDRLVRLDLCIEAGPDADADELVELTVELRERLRELDIESAEPTTAGQAPSGTRASELFVAGALTLMVVQSSGLLTALVETVQSWVSCRRQRSVKLKLDDDVLEVDGITRADQRELIQEWIRRHTDQ